MIADGMIDFTHDNLPAVLAAATIVPGDLIAIYDTGSPGIRETIADAAELAGHEIVWIDQAGSGSPVADATVRDVESRAWTVAAAVDRANWHAARATIYISYGRLGELVAAGWDGDVWVARWTGIAPSSPPPVPAGAKFRIVAEQWVNRGTYDVSAVFDASWPGASASPVPVPPIPANWAQLLPVIRQGAIGESVRTIQGLAAARGAHLAIDGIFGQITTEAVKYVQAHAGIAVDGIVGPHTWPALMGVA